MGSQDDVGPGEVTLVLATDAPDGPDLLTPIAEAHDGSVFEQKGLDGDPFPWVLAVPATVAALAAVRDVVIAILEARKAAKITVGDVSISGFGPDDTVGIIALLAEHGLVGPGPAQPDGTDDEGGTGED